MGNSREYNMQAKYDEKYDLWSLRNVPLHLHLPNVSKLTFYTSVLATAHTM